MASPTLAASIFNKLTGSWSFQRKVSDFGVMSGKAVFKGMNENLLKYREEGVQESGLNFFREYFYKNAGTSIEVYFDEKLTRHFQDLTFKSLEVQADHYCGCDIYESLYDFRSIAFGKFEVTHKVKGPHKDYTSHTQYTKTSD
jgi:hypothetical protein